MRPNIAIAALMIASASGMQFVQADVVVDISDNGASYFFDPSNPQTANFTHQNPSVGDVLFEDNFIFRYFDNSGLAPTTYVRSLSASTSGNLVYNGTTNTGNTAVSSWDMVGGLFAPVTLYNVTLTQTLTATGNSAVLDYQWDVTNVGGTAGSSFALFHFFDYDITDFSTNSAASGFDTNGDVRIDMTGDVGDAFVVGSGADRYELRAVGAGPRLTADILGSTSYNLDLDPPTLSMVDINAAIQWDFVQAAIGQTVSFSGQATVVSPIPEPSTVWVFLCGSLSLAGVWFVRRRRR